MNEFFTSFPEIEWPALPSSHAAGVLAMLFELEQSQWWSPEQLTAHQFRQLAHIVEHAYRCVPYYHATFDALQLAPRSVATPERWQEVPLLKRRDLQVSGERLHSCEVPTTHGNISRAATGGSTNQPVTTLGTELTEFFWRVLTLRDHFWHARDFSQPFAAIRYRGDNQGQPPLGLQADNWGSANENILPTGLGYLLNVTSTIDQQADWLRQVNPGYVLSYPSALLALAQLFDQRRWKLPRLRELCTFGEIMEPECRATCQRVFGVEVVDMYSSQEVGYIAFQCPEHEHYHVQAENLLVEIVDDLGRPCQAGQIGRVVVTTLHNFAMPLLRYDIGDYAEVGGACPCGRGLPVLKRILGRQRNLLVLPDGRRRWPLFDAGDRPEELPPYYQFQVIQRSLQRIEVLAVRDQPLTERELERVKRYMQQTLGHPFEIDIRVVESIPRSRTGKFEDFISEVA